MAKVLIKYLSFFVLLFRRLEMVLFLYCNT